MQGLGEDRLVPHLPQAERLLTGVAQSPGHRVGVQSQDRCPGRRSAKAAATGGDVKPRRVMRADRAADADHHLIAAHYGVQQGFAVVLTTGLCCGQSGGNDHRTGVQQAPPIHVVHLQQSARRSVGEGRSERPSPSPADDTARPPAFQSRQLARLGGARLDRPGDSAGNPVEQVQARPIAISLGRRTHQSFSQSERQRP
ncbi:hypothetical protein D3C72_1738440 [compost metagenome]